MEQEWRDVEGRREIPEDAGGDVGPVRRERRAGARKRANYYATRAMSRLERTQLSKAGEIEGLEDEIAMLRARLRAAMSGPLDRKALRELRAATEAMETLIRAVAVQYKLSPKSRRDLADHMANVLNALGDQFGLPER